ncbi:copper homeostasis protein CutC [Actinoplanes sp. NPDC051513]|uniref:copper homeostasis protein CutC n=1 Tax=Actinoplanes sp. NPDC051513 TaxID=3363908 RepID=UPI0037A68141
MVAFELAVQDSHGLTVAARLAADGVDRIELCSALALGGLTPSLGLILTAAATAGLPPAHVLVRPRPGGFVYSPGEAAVITADIGYAVSAGAAGVVVGGVRDGKVDTDLMARVVHAAGERPVTFHRAFDTLEGTAEAVETLIDLGVARILASATDLATLATAVDAAAGRIEIMAGGGVRPHLVEKIVRTGVDAIHASAKHAVPDPGGLDGERTRETTDEPEATRIIAALRAATA